MIATWQSTVDAVATAVAALGLIFAARGVFLARQQIGQAREQLQSAREQIAESERTRHAQIAADFSRRWDEHDLIETRQLARQYETAEALRDAYLALESDKATDEVLRLLREPDYFEDLAILKDLGAIDYEFIRRSLGDLVVRRWTMWEEAIDAIRDANGRDNYPAFRALAAQLGKDDSRS